MTQFTLASAYKGACDYTFWRNEFHDQKRHRAEHRGYALRLPSITNEKTARLLAQEFNAQMAAENENARSTILERHGAEMLAQVWKPFEPVQRVIFCEPGLGEKASEL